MGVLRALRFERRAEPHEAGKSAHRAVFLEVIERALKRGSQYRNVLDLGAALGANVDFLSKFARKIHLEDLGSIIDSAKTAPVCRFDSLCAANSGTAYDLILCWDLLNYLAPADVKALGRLLAAVAHSGTLLVAYIGVGRQMSAKRCTIRLCPGHKIEFERHTTLLSACPRYSKSQLRAFLPAFRRCRSHLLSNGFEEYLFVAK